MTFINLASRFVSAIPDLSCKDLGSFGWTQGMYDTQFDSASTSAFATTLLYFDSTSGTEAHYACLDASRSSALISYAVNTLGVSLPSSVLTILSQVFNLIHIDGMMVFSDANSIDSATQSAMTTTIQAQIPSFTIDSSLYTFDKTSCV
jgi:hypothetical protein